MSRLAQQKKEREEAAATRKVENEARKQKEREDMGVLGLHSGVHRFSTLQTT